MSNTEIYWPPDLPQCPWRQDFTYGLANNTETTEMELGPPKTRRRSTARPNSMVFPVYLKQHHKKPDGTAVDQIKLFKDFFALVGNYISFWLPDPEDQTRYIHVKIKAASQDTGAELRMPAPFVVKINLQLMVWPNDFRSRA